MSVLNVHHVRIHGGAVEDPDSILFVWMHVLQRQKSEKLLGAAGTSPSSQRKIESWNALHEVRVFQHVLVKLIEVSRSIFICSVVVDAAHVLCLKEMSYD